MHSKSYTQHLRDSKGCGVLWRLLTLKDSFDKSTSESLTKFRVVPARCNSKACPYCARLRFNKIRRNFKFNSVSNRWRFFTLTTKNSGQDSPEMLKSLEISFCQLRKHLKRKFPEFQYIAVRELSPSGMWHIHGLWNIYIPIKELSSMWKKYSRAYRVYIEKVHSPRGALNYIFKYCFKSIWNEEERRIIYECDTRKFTTSRGLLDKSRSENPYNAEFGTVYTVQEIKEKLFNLVVHSQCTSDDFSSTDYPYFEDLIQNCYSEFYEKSPPDLFQ